MPGSRDIVIDVAPVERADHADGPYRQFKRHAVLFGNGAIDRFQNRQRISTGLRSPGVLLALPRATVGQVCEGLLLIQSSSREEEWADQIHYLPSLSGHVFRRPTLDSTLRLVVSNPKVGRSNHWRWSRHPTKARTMIHDFSAADSLTRRAKTSKLVASMRSSSRE